MFKNVAILSVLTCSLALSSACGSRTTVKNTQESQKVDSLIIIREINERTLLVNFGYDAVTAVKTASGIVLIDAGISTTLTSRYKLAIENKFNQKNFIYIINSHGHHDHIRGNSLFPDAQVVGHENCRADASEKRSNTDSVLVRIASIVNDYDQKLHNSIPYSDERDDNFTQKIRYAGSYSDLKNNIPFRFPGITFSDTLDLECGDITFKMYYFGKFHSNSDILIYSPELKILFTGDLFSKYGRSGMSNPADLTGKYRWLEAAGWTGKRINNIETVIDGHGQILAVEDLILFNNNLLSKYSGDEIR